MNVFQLHQVTVKAEDTTILEIPQLQLSKCALVSIAGPNGAGKSTLLSVLGGLVTQFTGECLYRGKDVRHWSRRDFAREVTLLMQNHPVAFPFSAEEVVLMGRTPHAPGWFESPDDLLAAHDALEKTDSWHLRSRDFRTLSAGEQQRVILAAALAQQPEVLLLDEPSSFLDLHHQVQLYKLLTRLRDSGMLIVIISHDLNLSAAYSDRILLLSQGRIVADDTPQNVVTTERIKTIFQVDAELHYGRNGGVWMRYGF